jgi:ATP-dependent RNA helicase RhlE
MTVSVSRNSTGFDRFGLKDALMRGIKHAGFEDPRQIQLETVPAGLAGRDVLGLAQTGTGKTAAFALPLLDRLLDTPRKGPRALVIAPTRELATQIAAEFRTLSKFTGLKSVTIYGGVSMQGQINTLKRRPEIVVGCPGRVLDLLNRGLLHLGQVETLVLDEADHMFDMGFLPDIRKIIAALPKQRQNLLFSATMPKDIRRLANDLLNDPHVVELANAAPASTVDHALYMVAEQSKRALLEHVLSGDDCDSAIVFTRTKHRAKRLADQLSKAGHRAVGLQGNMSQSQRDRAMRGFRSRNYDILVATDIAARGIDVSAVSHVINFDVPNTPEAYTHRIGRTGRSELDGVACTFVTSSDRAWVKSTENMIGSRIPRRTVDGFESVADENPRQHRSQGQSRNSGKPRGSGHQPRANGGKPRSESQSRSNGRPQSNGKPRSNGNGQSRSRSHQQGDEQPRSGRRNAGFRSGSGRRPR